MKIYLAGPDVFRKNAIEHLEGLKKLCKKYKFEGLAPLDNIIKVSDKDAGTSVHSNLIFKSIIKLIKECNVVIANIEPFRGACIDDGTAFEIGAAFALGKKIYGYTSYNECTLEEVTEDMWNINDDNGHNHHNKEYPIVENFGNCVNLMICDSILDSGGSINKTFEDCLIALNANNIKEEYYYKQVIDGESHIMEEFLHKFGEDSNEEDNFHIDG